MKTTKKKTKEMNRRDFIKISSVGATAAAISFSIINPDKLYAISNPIENDSEKYQKEVKKDLFKVACSGSLFLFLNRNFGYPKEEESLSVASLSGGILQKGYQCGMLWGATLATGAESFRRYKNINQAIGNAIIATQNIIQSFSERTKCTNCRDITHVDWSRKLSITKYFITGKLFTCLNIAKKWAPEALQSAEDGLNNSPKEFPEHSVSCATEVARKLGENTEETIMVSGFAGGMGLSGNACGALGAAIWLRSRAWCRENPDSRDMYNPYAKRTIEAFEKETKAKFLCKEICGRRFMTIKEHTEFINNGGCSKLINVIAQA
jgi:hypothetical protein